MDKEKGCGIAALIGMTVGCLFLVGFGIFMMTVAQVPPIGFLCGGVGILGLAGCIALWIVMIRQSKQDDLPESKRQWPTGVLTDKIIYKDLYAHSKTVIVSWFVMTGILAFFAVLVICFSEQITLTSLALGVSPLVTLFLAIKAILDRNASLKYRIETDKVLSTDVKKTLDMVDALTTHLPMDIPVLYLEKHGEYQINALHIHEYYHPKELVSCIEPGEEVFVVYSLKTNELLHIYRKKYWQLKESR